MTTLTHEITIVPGNASKDVLLELMNAITSLLVHSKSDTLWDVHWSISDGKITGKLTCATEIKSS
jgi:hypothetical protein